MKYELAQYRQESNLYICMRKEDSLLACKCCFSTHLCIHTDELCVCKELQFVKFLEQAFLHENLFSSETQFRMHMPKERSHTFRISSFQNTTVHHRMLRVLLQGRWEACMNEDKKSYRQATWFYFMAPVHHTDGYE